MTNEQFIKEVADIENSIRLINGDLNKTKRWHKVNKIESEILNLNIKERNDNCFDIYYDNNIQGMVGYFQRDDPKLIVLFMILYANVLYYTMNAKPYVTSSMYKKLYEEKARLGKAIREMCTTGYSNCNITERQCRIIRNFIGDAILQLHHCVGPIGEYSTIVIPKDSRRLKEIRGIYESFKIGRKYVYFYDEILEKNMKIPIDSPDFIYAIMMLFAQAYAKSIIWLKKYDPTEQWCPITVWKIIQDFRILLTNVFLYHKDQ